MEKVWFEEDGGTRLLIRSFNGSIETITSSKTLFFDDLVKLRSELDHIIFIALKNELYLTFEPRKPTK